MLGSSILKDRNHLLFIIESLVLQKFFVVGFQSLSCVQLFATPWTAAHQASLSSTISQSLLKFTSMESAMLSEVSEESSFGPLTRLYNCPR